MAEPEFTQIFTDLQKMEEELARSDNCQQSRERCYHRLMQLRKRMDHYIESWLYFEEKINDLQEKFGFSLPDELPESVLNAFLKVVPEAAPEKNSAGQNHQTSRGVSLPDLPSNEEASLRFFRKGLGFLELAMMDEAIAQFKQVATLEPDLLIARLCLGVAYAEKGQTDEAMRELRLVQALTDDRQTHAIIHNSLGNLYADAELYDLALPEFEKAVELTPNFAAARFNLAAAYYNVKEYERSLESFLAILNSFPRDWEIYFYLGKAYKKMSNDADALVNLLKAAHLAPGQFCVFFELGLLYEQLGETRRALECYYRARKLYLGEDGRKAGEN